MQLSTTASADGTPISYRTLGQGPGVLLVGGALRHGEDYLPLAHALAPAFTVHVLDRRGRGASGPQGPDYTLRTEVEDLLAVQAAVAARFAFGHSYGGLVVLEAARTSTVLERITVYEPGVSAQPFPTQWMAPYRERLDAGDGYGAFAHFLKGSGGAPAVVGRLPYWYLRLALRVGFRGRRWARTRSLLASNLVEHEQVAAHAGRLEVFSDVRASVLVLCGSRGGDQASYRVLREAVPDITLEVMEGLDHFGPEGKSAAAVAERVSVFLSAKDRPKRS